MVPLAGVAGDEIRDLEAENSDLKSQVATAGYDKLRLEEYDGLTQSAESLGGALVPARVVGLRLVAVLQQPVTIDAGSERGDRHDGDQQRRPGRTRLRVTRTRPRCC